MFSLDEILTPETRDEVLATLLALSASLDAPTTSWVEGDPILTFLTTDAQKSSDLTIVAVEIAKGGFGELLPSDAWADLWAQSRFNETRVPATAATGYIDATNSSPTEFPFAAKEFIVAHDDTGKVYRNSEDIVIPPSGVLEDIAIEAEETGTASNAAPNKIRTVVSSAVGVTVTNPGSLLGTDKETTTALVNRSRAKLGSFSPNGPKDAYDYAAKTPGLSPTSVPITRTRTVLDVSTGTLTTYLATAGGAPSVDDVEIVQSAFDQYVEPWGANSVAAAADEVTIPITYQAWAQGTSLTELQIKTKIESALVTWFALLDIGGYVIPPDTGAIYVDVLEQVIGQAMPGVILRVVVSVPAATQVLLSNEVAKLGTVTGSVIILT